MLASAAAVVPLALALVALDGGDVRHQKPTTVEVQPIERRVTKPEAPAARDPRNARPTIRLPDFVAEHRERLRRITDAQIAKMRRLLEITQEDDPAKPDYDFRLGELYAENERVAFAQARALDQRIFEAQAAGKPALQREQQGYEREEQSWLLQAVKAYIAATKFARYERMDEVLFRLAALLTGAKKEAEAREFFHRLIKDYPTSRYIPDAYLAFAEFYFDKGEMESALRFYDKVAEFPKSSVYPYAVYKKGWCYINLGQHKEALETFVGVVRMARDLKSAAAGRQLELLAKEAKKDIVKAYARVGGPEKAWPFFQRTGGDYAPKMLEALAELYWEDGQADDSTRVYRKIVAENMGSPRVCEWQGKILRNAFSAGDKRAQTQELERLAAVYGALRAGKPAPKRDLLDECRVSLHDAARETAIIWHREAQKTQDLATFALAARAYRTFLAAFPDDKDAYEMTYYEGETLWTLKRWTEAAAAYTRVAEMNPSGKYLRDAAYAAVLAWKNALLVDDEEQRGRVEAERTRVRAREQAGPSALAPLPIPDNQQKMIAAFHAYRKHVPDAPELPVMLYQEGYICYDYNHFDCAEQRFGEVVERYPTHKLAIFAANLYIDALNAEGKTAAVLAAVDRFLEVPALVKDAEFLKGLISIKSDGFDVEGRAFEKRGDYKQCGRSMLASAEALPDHPKHAERLWNAGQCFQNAHLVGQAVKAWQALIAAHPAGPLASKALFRVAAGYHQLAYYGMAAERYEEFARRFPGEKRAVAALGNATVFREGLGEADRALDDMDAFVKFYGERDPEDAAGVFFQKGEVYERQGRQSDLRAHLQSYLDRWARHGGLDRQVQAHFRLGELAWRASCPHASEDGACVQITRVTSTRGRKVLEDARRRLGKPSKRTQCGGATKSKIVVLDRNRAEAAAAETHFREAIRLWKGGEGVNPIAGRDADARRAAGAYAAAGAAFTLAEREYEELLRVKFPQHLDFSRPSANDGARRQAATRKKFEDSKRRFAAYLEDKARLLEKARADYLDVFKLRQAQWTIAAAARVGQLHQDFAGQLYTAEIPADLPEVDPWGNRPRDLYCDELEDQAGKIEAQATDGFKSCLGAATKESWYNEWSRLCERELNQLEPVQFPLSSEVKPEAGFVPLVMSAASVTATLGEDAPPTTGVR
jgi:TolA-binding protein